MEKGNMKDNKENKNNDYIVIGELRDEKAFKEALNASTCGHLVLTSACFNCTDDFERIKKVL